MGLPAERILMHSVPGSKIAPGPPGHFLLGHLREFRQDVLSLMVESARRYGDVVRFRLGGRTVHMLNHPDLVEHVLQRNRRNYDKQTPSAGNIRTVCGESLLTANDQAWQRRRRRLQPSFHQQSIRTFADQMVAATVALLESWKSRAGTGQALDMASEMTRLTCRIVGSTLFSADVGADLEAIERIMEIILPHTYNRLGNLVNPPDWFPTPANLRFRQALRRLDDIVYRIIRQHRHTAAGDPIPQDLLSMLLRVRDDETGEGFSDEELRNETVTFLLAGHETTANALTWTLYLLSQHPEVERPLRDEIRVVLGGRVPTLEDLPALAYTKMVIREAMRLYPPIWIIERRAITADVASGYIIPAGSSVVMSPYLLHRHPGFWDRPDEFQPERFLAPVSPAYIPFGAGPRFCIGNEFAMLEAQLITVLVVQAHRLRLVPGHPVEPNPGISLRTRCGVRMTLHEAGQ